MWKKIMLACITFIGSVSIGYAFVRQMSAASTLNIAKLIPGYEVILGTNPNGQEVVWDVHVENADNYTLSTYLDRVQHCTQTTDNISQNVSKVAYCNFISTVSGKDDKPAYVSAKAFDDAFYASNQTNSFEQTELIDQSSISSGNLKRAFIPSPAQISSGGILGITSRSDLLGKETERFALSERIYDPLNKAYAAGNAGPFVRTPLSGPGGIAYSEWTSINWAYHTGNNPTTNGWAMVDVRPFAQVRKDRIVSVLNSGYQKDTLYNLTQSNNRYKIRYEDPAYSVSFNDIKFQGISITGKRIIQNQTIELDATASDTLCVYIFNDAGSDLLYYKALNGKQLDLTGIPVGKYKIAVTNEHFDSSTGRPTPSSALSSMLALEIVAPHQIVYTKQPESGATSGNDYEFMKNVNSGQTIGKITVGSQGVMPLSYTVESNGDQTYQNFEIDGLDANHSSSSLTLNVKIKSNAPDLLNGSLRTGTYQFCINSVDANGSPTQPENGKTRVCTSLLISPTNVSVAFQTPSQTKKSMSEAQSGWQEEAVSTPSNGTKITYSIISTLGNLTTGDVGIDPDTGVITYHGNNAYGKLTIQASADDDPASGMDNYRVATVTKEVVIYRMVNGSISPDANSSDANIPTFSASDPNAKVNGTIATIRGSEGTPDNAVSGITTYRYEIKPVDDYASFEVLSNGTIKTKVNLGVKEHHITLIVKDQWSTKEIPLTIKIEQANAENLQFYENQSSHTVINTKTVNFTDTNVSVYATVKGSSNTNPVIYQVKDGSTNVIEVNSNSGAITIKGAGSVTIVATKQGMSGQADAKAELTFTVTAAVQNFIYTTDSTLTTERPKNGDKYEALKETYQFNQTFYVYTTGNPTGSTVTYQLKAGSPTDVISVDPDGLVHILNASMNTQIGKVVIEATSHDPSGNFADKTIELPITIEKGTRTVTFQDDPLYVINGSGSVVPNILTNGILDTEGNTVIEVDPNANTVAWTSDGITIQYNWSDAQGKDVKIHVTKPADRNYKLAEGDGTLHILGADESALTLSTPGKITYGDHFTIRSTQDDSMSSNVQYTFETDNQVFVSAPQVNGNRAEFDALAYSGNTEITIKVTRTADGELPLTKTVKIKVLPKPITIEIEDKEKLRLEENPPLTFKDFSNQLVAWNGVKDNVDTTHINLSTTAKKYSPIGSYPITAGNAQKQLNDNYPNYTFTIKDGLLNVLDNGNKDFWDVDHDGCPDVNIEIKDDDGNPITINGDKNDDGIPDYNIDINGDGKPELNMDTDSDGKPDLNLVILKEWKPSQCITLGDIQFSSGITAKPEINIDLDKDGIPDINIDTDGDFKADFNIDTDGDGKANVNIGAMHSQWKPDHDYKVQNFAYDSIEKAEPLLNIDTDGDGRPDLNLDLDEDGIADLNIDTDGDWIPDVNIDGNGDGKPDYNLDPDEDGNPTKDIIHLDEWKPEHNAETPFPYDTMKIENETKLEDNGVIIEKEDGSSFSPNLELKVIDITAYEKANFINQAADFIQEQQEVKQVFEIKLLENGTEIQPDGTLKIRIPIKDSYINAHLVRQKADGTYEPIEAVMEDGYLVYESEELGIVAIIADESEKQVAGSYYPGANTGGALTGDTSNPLLYVGLGVGSFSILCFLFYKQRKTMTS